jgi:quinol monooxygenase YgiN
MICVLARIELREGQREEFLKVFRGLVPTVLREDGCFEYGPMIDVPANLGVATPVRDNVVTIVEKWASVEALQRHLAATHMMEYRQTVKALVAGVELQILQPA